MNEESLENLKKEKENENKESKENIEDVKSNVENDVLETEQKPALPSSPEERIYNKENQKTGQTMPDDPLFLKKARKRKFLKPLIIAIILLAIGGSAFAGLYLTGNLEKVIGMLPFGETPEEILAEMNENMSQVKTYDFDAEANGNCSISSGEAVSSATTESQMLMMPSLAGEINYKLNTNGSIDQTNLKNPKFSANFDGTVGMEGIDVSFGGEGKFLDKIIYFKINEIPYGSMIEQEIPFKIKDQWFKLALNDLHGEAEFSEEKFDEMMDLILEANSWEKSSGIIVEEELPIEEINGVKAYHYRGKLDKKAIKGQFSMFSKILETEFSEEDIKESEKELDKMLENFEGNVELWIGKKDKLLYKMTLRHNFELSPEDFSGSKIKMQGVTTYSYSNFNGQVLIKAPEDVQDINKLMNSFLYQDVEKTRAEAKDAKRISDLNMFIIPLEMYYDGDGHSSYPVSENFLRISAEENILSKALKEYIPVLPVDPKDPEFFYGYKSNGQTYELTAVLEDPANPQCAMEGGLCIFKIRNGEVVSKK